MKTVLYLKLKDGRSPLIDWLDSLDKAISKRIKSRFVRLEEGNYGDCKKLVNSELSELRYNFGKGYRVYYAEVNNVILLLINGGDKSSQTKDIANAQKLLNEWRLDNE
ncbi:MAG: type II toxin-antitoxin system RelE/ParE family toxin [Acidobacteriota bacterium]|jgi:putative addiction module killer protein|nr:type II toxin-antitoxin system RelE/ParE family toxin [Acidobacteriota bacterium]